MNLAGPAIIETRFSEVSTVGGRIGRDGQHLVFKK